MKTLFLILLFYSSAFSQQDTLSVDSTQRRVANFDFSQKIELQIASGFSIRENSDTTVTDTMKRVLSLRSKTFTPVWYENCNDYSERVDNIRVKFTLRFENGSYEKTLQGTSLNGKQKWRRDISKLPYTCVAMIRSWKHGYFWEHGKWDTLIVFEPETYYVMKSKNGRMKRVERSELFSEED